MSTKSVVPPLVKAVVPSVMSLGTESQFGA
jgi:hypothetical protein